MREMRPVGWLQAPSNLSKFYSIKEHWERGVEEMSVIKQGGQRVEILHDEKELLPRRRGGRRCRSMM